MDVSTGKPVAIETSGGILLDKWGYQVLVSSGEDGDDDLGLIKLIPGPGVGTIDLME